MYGYAGAILRIDLTNRKVSAIDTGDYEEWGGGHGIGTALFWDLCKDKTVSGFDPGNVVTMMTSPFAGAPVPTGGSRMEVQGIAVEGYPFEWFTRSNFGGRFAAMLKYAGWDGIVIEGKAEKPVWIDIRDRTKSGNLGVRIRDASSLWGLDTWQTQQQVQHHVCDGQGCANTVQKPAVVAISPAGENRVRFAALIHDSANAAGQGGFGSVFGSKNLKAISVIGTGGVKVADPAALTELRLSHDAVKKYDYPRLAGFWPPQKKNFRPSGCLGCNHCDVGRYARFGNDSQCVETLWSNYFDEKKGKKDPEAIYMGADLIQKMGVNAYQVAKGYDYLIELNRRGILGKGMEIDCDLPFDRPASIEFAEQLIRMISYREGLGDTFAEGFPRAAEIWGRREDFKNGILLFPYWGYGTVYDPRPDLTWGYASVFGERDCNEHAFNVMFWLPSIPLNRETTPDWMDAPDKPALPAEMLATIMSAKMRPYDPDPRMLDCSTENRYSAHMAKTIAWQKHYNRFWKHSILICDQRFPNLLSPKTLELEPAFWAAVTGKKLDFLEGMALGKKIWDLENAIWALQGRHKDNVHFTEYVYQVPYPKGGFPGSVGRNRYGSSYYLPGIENGKWQYINMDGRCHDKEQFNEFKSKVYREWDWDPETGWPKRSTLEAGGLKAVADELEKEGKLGSEDRSPVKDDVA